jgi:hypothetical protein
LIDKEEDHVFGENFEGININMAPEINSVDNNNIRNPDMGRFDPNS